LGQKRKDGEIRFRIHCEASTPRTLTLLMMLKTLFSEPMQNRQLMENKMKNPLIENKEHKVFKE